MLYRSLSRLGWSCCILGLLGGHLWAQTHNSAAESADRTTLRPQLTDLELQITEVHGPLADLEKMTAEELFTKPAGTDRKGALVMNIEGQVDLSLPTEVKIETQIPTATRGQSNVKVSYRRQGVKLQISGAWKKDRAELRMNGTMHGSAVPDLGVEEKQAARPVELERTLQAPAGKPVLFKFQDKPLPIGDPELAVGRLHVARLIARPMAAPTRAADPSNAHQALINLQVFVLSAEREKIEKAELNTLIAQAPSGEEILRRLGEYGSAHQVADFQTVLDLASEQEISVGERVPILRDVQVNSIGRIVPSFSYGNIGMKFDTEPARWKRSSGGWVCDLEAELETCHIGESSVKVTEGMRLPTFNTTKLEGRRRFQSGQPEYFLCCGVPTPLSEEGTVPVYVARVVLTRVD